MKQYILALVLAVVSASVAFAVNPIKEGNMISGHVIVKGTEENIPYATVLIIGSGQGTVLYLALEDDYARLQKRLSQMFGMEGSENFYFATKSKSLNDGLEKQLVTFVTEHKDARLIIIDTLQKVREVGGDKFSYASDYEIVTKLKAFSDKYGICFLLCIIQGKWNLQIVLI